MIENYSNIEQINRFLQGEKQIAVPFSFETADEKYIGVKVLRLVPSKRLVLEASTDSHHVVIKIFSPVKKGLQELNKEVRGHKLASDAEIKVPSLISTSEDIAGCFAVIYKFVENAKSFTLSDGHVLEERVVKLLELVLKLHLYGIYQDDIHMDNVLMVNNELYLIDLGSVVCEQKGMPLSQKASLENLAKLVAQFTVIEQDQFVKHLEIYYQGRNWLYNNNEHDIFMLLLNKAWNKRKNNYVHKCFRTCTMTIYRHSLAREYAFRTDFFNGFSVDIVNNIELLMSQGEVLKAGNSATVVRIEDNGRQFVIKRYNVKGVWHFVRRCLRPSRALVSWRNANLLEFVGLSTPKAQGFIEKRVGWFRYTAYYICDYIQAEQLLAVYKRRQPSEVELKQINSIFLVLKKCRVSHGDLKASNLLIDNEGKVLIIDLDAMQEHKSFKSFQKAHNKDKKRFLRNWDDAKINSIFTKLIC